MSAHSHACTFCGQHYDCTAPMVENHDGWPNPVCVAQQEPNLDYQSCAGCREHGCCEDCEAAPAGSEINPFYCEPCAQKWQDNREPPEPDYDGVTIHEQCAAADRERRELRRRD